MEERKMKYLDLLFREYERNEEYHDKKESRIWVACALYYGFSFALFGYIHQFKELLIQNVWFLYVVMGISAISIVFISQQCSLKSKSVIRNVVIKKRINNELKKANELMIWNLSKFKLCNHGFYRVDLLLIILAVGFSMMNTWIIIKTLFEITVLVFVGFCIICFIYIVLSMIIMIRNDDAIIEEYFAKRR